MLILVDKIINELDYKELTTKQKTITNLFPPFYTRVQKVAGNGGVRLVGVRGNVWSFTVTSGTQKGKKYQVNVRFKGLKQSLHNAIQDEAVWKKDMSGVDLRKLASKLFWNLNIELLCNCPAFQYWGPAYQATKGLYKFGRRETRPAKIRNPREYGAYCKHTELLMNVLPNYIAMFGTYLDRFYGNDIKRGEAEFKRLNQEVEKEIEVEEEE